MLDNKPFFYAVADNEGKPVMDEICCCESPTELEDYFRDDIDDLKVKVVPVYTGPQIESMRDLIAAFVRRYEWDGHRHPDGSRGYDAAVMMETQRAIDALIGAPNTPDQRPDGRLSQESPR